MALTGNSDDTNGYNSVIKTGEANNANHVKSVIPPIGSILPWAKSMTGVPSLPDGWLECDGSTISDSDSPMNGEDLPDLNSTQRFLRGASSSGGTGGSDTHNHQWFESAGNDSFDSNGNSESMNEDTYDAGGAKDSLFNITDETDDLYTNNASTLPAYFEVVFIMRVK